MFRNRAVPCDMELSLSFPEIVDCRKTLNIQTPRILTLLKFQDTINTNNICVMHHNLEAISHRFTVESDVRKLRAKSAASVTCVCLTLRYSTTTFFLI